MSSKESKKDTSPLEKASENHTELEEEEEELGIYSDEDDDCEDLSDNEPPLTEQDTSGRPQSQFKLRVMSAALSRQVEAAGAGVQANCLDLNHVDSGYNFDEDDSSDQFDDLDINSDLSLNQSRLESVTRRDNLNPRTSSSPKQSTVKG